MRRAAWSGGGRAGGQRSQAAGAGDEEGTKDRGSHGGSGGQLVGDQPALQEKVGKGEELGARTQEWEGTKLGKEPAESGISEPRARDPRRTGGAGKRRASDGRGRVPARRLPAVPRAWRAPGRAKEFPGGGGGPWTVPAPGHRSSALTPARSARTGGGSGGPHCPGL